MTESGSYIDDSAPATVVIAEGATTGTLTVSTEDDTTDEPDGSITVRITTGAGYTVGTLSAALVTVLDDDVLLASITAADPTTITEGATATFRVTLGSAAPAGGLTISVDVTESGSYIADSAPATVVIAEGATTVTLTVSTEDDSLDESDGSITVRITTGAGYTVGTPSTALVTVNDNDIPDPDAPVVSISAAAPTTITEGAAATFTVALDRAAPAGGLTISVDVTESGSYIADLAPETVVIAEGATTGTLTVSTEDDSLDEPDGSITVRITTGTGYTVGTLSAALVTVSDNDVLLARITAADPTTITEGEVATFTVALDRVAAAGGLTVSVGVTESGSYIAETAPTTVVIAEGATTGTLTVLTDDDNRDESDGAITVRITTGAGYTVGSPNAAMVTVSDNDVAPSPDAPVARISAADPTTITEGTAATFTVALDRAAPAGGLTISVDVTESGSYIADLAPATVVIASGATTVTLAVSTEDDSLDETDGAITAELNAGAGYTVGTLSTAMVTVNDDDVLLASITTADPTTITEGTAATFTVTLDLAAPAGGLTISVGVTQSGSYIEGSAPETVVIAEGATTGTLTVSTEDDSLDETDGAITAVINAGVGYTVGTPSTAMVTVNDDDVLLVSITTADPTTITEGTAATFTVTLDLAAPAGGLTISVGVTQSGSYIEGSAPETVVIAEGATTGTLTVSTEDDSLDETDGSITAELNAGVGYTVGTPSTAMVTVNDDDVLLASITTADPTTITEGTAATFTVTLDLAAPAGGLTISVGVTQSGNYIEGSAPETVVIAEGATTGTLTVSTEDDSLDEPDGAITVRITTGVGYTVGTPSTAIATVNDNDIPDPDAPVVSISADPTPITEGDVATFRVALDRVAPADGLTVSVDVTESGSYIAGSAPATVVIAEGATTGTLTVPTADDNLDEPDGAITVRITTGAGYTVGTPSTAIVTVSDNDVAPSLDDPVARISAADPTTITEGEVATFTVALDRVAPAGGLTISVDVTENGSYIVGSASETVFITAGTTTGTLTVPTEDDNLDESDGSITVKITTGAGYTVGSPNAAVITVNDDDVLLVSISADPTPITEGDVATFRVALDRVAPADGLTVSVDVTESGSYIAGSAPATVVIAEGATTGTLTVPTADDNLDEPDGSITAELTTGAGYTVGTLNTALVTVNDNDIPDPDAPVVRITADPTPITEGDVATFRVALDRVAPAGGLTVSVAVTDSGSYIAGSASATVVIAEGATTVTLTVSTEDDTTDEPDGSITAELNAGAGYTVGTPSTAIVTVSDNDVLLASITAADPTTITEGEVATFRVTLSSAAPADGLTISVAVTESGSYIADSAPTTVVIAEGATTGTLTVSTDDDNLDESDGSITVRITTGVGYTVGTPSTALVTVNDNDIPDPDTPVVSISADPTTITEGVDAAFTVALDRTASAGGLTISVDVTESGSYIAGSAPTTVVIAEGATTGTLTVPTADDNLDEPDGSITVRITTGAGYTVGTLSTALVTVSDNDVAPSPDDPVARISAADPTTITEGEVATFRVTLGSAAAAGGLTISVDVTESGSYIAGSAPATVVIAEGATTVTLTVSTDNDEMIEETGSITVRITTGIGYTVADAPDNAAAVTVLDDDAPVVSITADPTTITEGVDAAFTVALDRVAPAGGLTISVDVTDIGSYIAGSAPATVVIAEGATTGTLTVPTADDNLDEPDGSITAALNAGAGYTVGTPSTAIVTVSDNDVLLARISAAGPTTITEGVDAAFTVALDRVAPAGGLTISVDVTEIGSYIEGSAPTTVVIAEGATTGTLTVPTADDNLDEPDGSITVRITTGAGYTVGTLSSAMVTVNDDDVLLASIAAGISPITEGTAAMFTVTLDLAAPAGGLTINVEVTESGRYIASSAPMTVAIAGGATSGTLTVLIDDENRDELAGIITAAITTGHGLYCG